MTNPNHTSAPQILVVEDNETNLELMVYLLKSFGYAPLTARNGLDGLETATTQLPDLIICDLDIPRLNGYEVGRRLKTDPLLRKIPLIAVTALAMVGDRGRVLAAGFDGYIPKPIDPEKFVKQVAAFLPANKQVNCISVVVPPSSNPALPALKRATVLAVDDSAVNLSLIRGTLEPSGYRVITAQNIHSAGELMTSQVPDLIVCDLHMANGDGIEFLRKLKADPRSRSIPFLMLSASSLDPAERVAALALGARRYLARPIEPRDLLSEIANCLDRKES